MYNPYGVLNLSHSEVSNSYYGIRTSASTTISSSNIHDTVYGVAAYAGNLDLTNNTFYNNSYMDVYAAPGVTYTHSGNTYSGGQNEGIFKSGTLTSSETWNTDTIYVVTSTVTVANGVTLTIEHGAIVKFGSGKSIVVNGALDAQGTAEDKIYFTSDKDDSSEAGGDTNGDGGAVSATSGDWDAIQFDSGSTGDISHALIRYGGKYSGGEIYNNGGNLALNYSDISTSTTYGVYQASGTTTIEYSDIHDQSIGFKLVAGIGILNESSVHDTGLAGAYNDGGGLTVVSSTIATTTTYGIYSGGNTEILQSTISNQDYGVYVASDGFTIKDSELHHQDYGIYVGADNPQTASIRDSLLYDQMYGLFLVGETVAAHNVIHDDTYGIYATWDNAVIDVSELYNNDYGVYVSGAGATIKVTSSNIHDNHLRGVHVGALGTYGSLVMSADSIHGNLDYGVSNSTTKAVVAKYNYWGDATGPSGQGPGYGDKISEYVDYGNASTILGQEHYVNVNEQGSLINSVGLGNEIDWDGSTQFTDAWYSAMEKWNDKGMVTIATDTIWTTTELSISDDDSEDTPYVAYWYYRGLSWPYNDTLTFYSYYMSQEQYHGAPDQHAVMHELGHALGLAHSYEGNVMYYATGPGTTQTDLGDQDNSDYAYIWGP